MKKFLSIALIGLAPLAFTTVARAQEHHHGGHGDHARSGGHEHAHRSSSHHSMARDDLDNPFAANADDSARLTQQIQAYQYDIARASRLLQSRNMETRFIAQQLIAERQSQILQLQSQIDDLDQ